MLFPRIGCLMAFTAIATAAPYEKRFEGARRHFGLIGGFTNGLKDAVHNVGEGMGDVVSKLSSSASKLGQCTPKGDLPQSTQPLPPPSSGLSLYHIVVGRGTQNYTCDLSNSTAVPVATGATANLYDADCYAGYPAVSSVITTCALNSQDYTTGSTASSMYGTLMGHHYFTDSKTPYFNLDTENGSLGQGAFAKVASVAAPPNATAGKTGSGSYYGAVPWLKLTAKDASQSKLQEVYRVHTAGGQPPSTCSQINQSSFVVQYSAEYWFYS